MAKTTNNEGGAKRGGGSSTEMGKTLGIRTWTIIEVEEKNNESYNNKMKKRQYCEAKNRQAICSQRIIVQSIE